MKQSRTRLHFIAESVMQLSGMPALFMSLTSALELVLALPARNLWFPSQTCWLVTDPGPGLGGC